MIDNCNCLAIVPARGGSKGLPRKNAATLGGKPLIAWSIEAAHASSIVDRVVFSSEDEELRRLAIQAGCEVPFSRPAEFATDEALMGDVVLHALDALESSYDYVVVLQPTSPFRRSEDIDACVRLCHERGSPSCVTVSPSKPPQWIFTLDEMRLTHVMPQADFVLRRQDRPMYWSLNGAVYVARVPWFRQHGDFFSPETLALRMPSARSLDIDSADDLRLARLVVAGRQRG